jgi:hypothetical protein
MSEKQMKAMDENVKKSLRGDNMVEVRIGELTKAA